MRRQHRYAEITKIYVDNGDNIDNGYYTNNADNGDIHK